MYFKNSFQILLKALKVFNFRYTISFAGIKSSIRIRIGIRKSRRSSLLFQIHRHPTSRQLSHRKVHLFLLVSSCPVQQLTLVGMNGSPQAVFDSGRLKSTKFFMAFLASQDTYTSRLRKYRYYIDGGRRIRIRKGGRFRNFITLWTGCS